MGWFKDSKTGEEQGIIEEVTQDQIWNRANINTYETATHKKAKEGKQEWRDSPRKMSIAPNTYRYPQDIGTDSQPNSIIFKINAREQSKAAHNLMEKSMQAHAAGDENARKDFLEAQNKKNKWYTNENRTKSETAKDVAAATGLMSGTTFGPAASQMVTGGQGVFRTPLATAYTGIKAAQILSDNVHSTSTVRLLDAIQLHIPTSQTSQYSAQWTETNLGLAGMPGSGRVSLAQVLENPDGSFGSDEMRRFGARGVIGAAASLPKALGADADFAGAMEAATKEVANPFKEQLFKSMGFRKFAFNYVFSPRNREELKNIMEILKKFKYHMHPERSMEDLFLIYPSEFNMMFKYKNEENDWIHKISTCILNDMKVTYGSDGTFTTIKGTQGAPSEIALQLAFTELETLDTERIDAGL